MQTFKVGSLSESLSTLQGSDLLANGCVNLIGVDAVRDRAGPLWARKRELVWTFTERKLRESLAPHDLMLRLDDTTFLVAVTTEHPTAAQAVCLRVLEQVLLHFIGHLDRADIRLRRVEAIGDGEILSSALDAAAIPALEDAPRGDPMVSPDPAKEREKNPLLFTSMSGRALRIDFVLRPVTSLQHGGLTALHLSQTVVDIEAGVALTSKARDALTDGDLIRIDEATLDYASLFSVGEQTAGNVALIIPVSYRTLLNRRGRAALVAAGAGGPALKAGGLFEIIDIDTGTPPSRLDEAVALARPLCRAVFARLPARTAAVAPFTDMGFAGLTVPLSRSGAQTIDGLRSLLGRTEGIRRAVRTLIALDAPRGSGPRLLDIGFSHASEAVEVPRTAGISPAPAPATRPSP